MTKRDDDRLAIDDPVVTQPIVEPEPPARGRKVGKEDERPVGIFVDGPYAGTPATLPEGTTTTANELHIPHPTGLCIYTLADPAAGELVEGEAKTPGYRLLRIEPIYRVPPTSPLGTPLPAKAPKA